MGIKHCDFSRSNILTARSLLPIARPTYPMANVCLPSLIARVSALYDKIEGNRLGLSAVINLEKTSG